MLEISTVSAEEQAGADLAKVYHQSSLCRCARHWMRHAGIAGEMSACALPVTGEFHEGDSLPEVLGVGPSCCRTLSARAMTVPSALLKHRGLGPSNTFSVSCVSRDNEELVDRLRQPEPGSQQLNFQSEHAQSLLGQYCVLLR